MDWLEQLPTAQFATAAFYVDLLAEQGPIVPLTVSRKTRMREEREVARARRAWQRRLAEAHTVDEPVGGTSDG